MAKNEGNSATNGSGGEAKEQTVGIDRGNYQKATSASGGASLNNGDLVANGIVGMEVDEIIQIATKMGVAKKDEDLSTKYSHLNVGMQRMNLGNRLRGRIAKIDTLNEKGEGKEGFKPTKSGKDQFNAVIGPFRKAADKRAATAQKAKDAAAKEKAKKADAKAKAADKKEKGKGKGKKAA